METFTVHFSTYTPRIGNLQWIRDRIKEVPSRWPRLRVVFIVDEKEHPQNYIRKAVTEVGGYIFYIKDYLTPESLIKNLTEIKVEPKDHPEILVDNRGAGI